VGAAEQCSPLPMARGKAEEGGSRWEEREGGLAGWARLEGGVGLD